MTDLPPLPPPGAAPTPPPPPPSPGAPAPGPSRARGVVLVVAVSLVLLLVGVGVGLLVAGDDPAPADDPTASPATTGGDAPSTTSGDGPTTSSGGDDELLAVVQELSDWVAEQRGHDFVEPVDVELVSEDEFQSRLLEDFEEGEEDLRQLERIFGALGLVDEDVDLVQALRDLLSVGVVGFYDPETDELVVRGDEVSPYARITIVHELVHALDDQIFDLDRPELDDVDDETGFGFSALVEGNARRLDERYRASLSDEERRDAEREEMALGFSADVDVSAIPLVLIELLVAPYELGEPFTLLLEDAGGEARIDEAFEDPPRTSSVVMHPERYLNGFEEVQVDPPPADGEIFDEGVFGELVLGMVLRDVVGTGDALDAADAWAGDWYVVWDEGDRTCLRVDVASFGDEDDREELRLAMGEWVRAQPDATLRREGDLLRMTACG